MNNRLSGDMQNHCLNASRDTALAIKTLPGLMIGMLREDGWKEMARPIDGKVFTHDSIDDWVLGEPWGGLHFQSWDMLYAILERTPEGKEARKLLIERGAPKNGFAEDMRHETAAGTSLRKAAKQSGKSAAAAHYAVNLVNSRQQPIYLAKDPIKAAQTIIKSRGLDYARALANALLQAGSS